MQNNIKTVMVIVRDWFKKVMDLKPFKIREETLVRHCHIRQVEIII